MKDKFLIKCAYCGEEFETRRATAKFCKPAHRVSAFKKEQIAELRRLKGKASH